ncbi:MAG: roadblock/LC7 domain-containing protein [Chloroflexi bacterium]|nr:MAG: roadblock/LC7 family protein [Chloroflexi bacterium OLB13]MBC6956344.1 hypothetical protein [Chloroflexota bacterium]MBV6435926.1 hypothetical protein [Anaerolineae bacterium]MDL1915408.1 hypothetical protein [Anaerolineae bacterium CFX4]OQY82265.1 MAG: hypothetical protein B6D42_09680 [Anaerolineae bacterium UTCFX5]
MTKSRTEQLLERLRELLSSTGDIEGAVVVSVDGLAIASALQAGVEEDRISAMSAVMLSLGERISGELGRGELEQVQVRGVNGFAILNAVGEEAVLTVMARKEARLGLILLEISRTVKDLLPLI